jgi:hypothetical protein
MAKCHRCNSKLALHRYRILTFTGYLIFCSRICKKAWLKKAKKDARRAKFLRWLAGETV